MTDETEPYADLSDLTQKDTPKNDTKSSEQDHEPWLKGRVESFSPRAGPPSSWTIVTADNHTLTFYGPKRHEDVMRRGSPVLYKRKDETSRCSDAKEYVGSEIERFPLREGVIVNQGLGRDRGEIQTFTDGRKDPRLTYFFRFNIDGKAPRVGTPVLFFTRVYYIKGLIYFI